jgi:hypothetical protein
MCEISAFGWFYYKEICYDARSHEHKKNAYSVLVGNPEGKRPLARPMRRLENDINKDREGR